MAARTGVTAAETRSVRAGGAGIRVNSDRLLSRIEDLAAIGRVPGGGTTRLAYSPEDIQGQSLVANWLRQTGLPPSVDAAGNVLATLPGRITGLPRLALGSHLDTVVAAGPLDGAYGLIAAIEVAARLSETGRTLRHPLTVIGFSNEEGARGTPGMVGSTAVSGGKLDISACDDGGVPLADHLRAVGGRPDELATAAWDPDDVAALFELHIEQGPVLENAGASIGIVDVITARQNLEIVLTGRAAHAGTTPMPDRRDALVSAARLTLAIDQLARSGAVRVATVGKIDASPGVRNVVAGAASLSVDVRDSDQTRLRRAVDAVRQFAARESAESGCAIDVIVGPHVAAVETSPQLSTYLRSAADSLGLTSLVLPSGAGHDCQLIAAIAPIALCFVPSRGGVSHAPDEWTAPADLIAGADVLLQAILEADERLDA